MEGHRVTMLGTGPDRPLLHADAARPAAAATACTSSTRAPPSAPRRSHASTASRTRRRTSSEAIADPETDIVVVGLPNHLHEEAIELCARHGKAVLCTKPLARNADEAKRILDTVENAGVFAGYLEDLVYTPKTLKAVQAVRAGQIGDVTWARSRETHPGPH